MSMSAKLLSAQVDEFRSIFPAVSSKRASELIEACTGNVERAIHMYLQSDEAKPSSSSAAETHTVSFAKPSFKGKDQEGDVIEIDDDDEEMKDYRDSASSSSSLPPSFDRTASRDTPAARKRKMITQTTNLSPSPATAASSSSSHASPSKKVKRDGKNDASIKQQQNALANFFSKSPTVSPSAAPTQSKSPNISPAVATSSLSTAVTSLSSKLDQSSESNPSAASSSSSPSVGVIDPNSASMNPLEPCFSPGKPVPFLFLSRIYHLIEGENGRLKIINYLTYLFWQILAYTPSDLPAALFLSSDQLAPSYENHSLGVGGSMLYKIVREMMNVSSSRLSADHARLGDLGLIAAQYRQTQSLLFRPQPLTLANVFKSFYAMKDMNKREQKELTLRKMFAAARESELTYLIRIAEGGLRVGAVITTVLMALAKAFCLHHLYTDGVAEVDRPLVCSFDRVVKATDAVRGAKISLGSTPFQLDPPAVAPLSAAQISKKLPSHLAQATARIRRAYAELPSFHKLVTVLQESPTRIYELDKHIRLTAGVPIKPQLGRPMKSILSVMKLFRNMPFTVEVKYDGLRAQIHRLKDGTYRIFSRHLMDQGDRWNDLIPYMNNAIRMPEAVTSFILDAEIVAVEHQEAEGAGAFRILPFQQLSTRRRGSSNSNGNNSSSASSSNRVEVSCMVYVFDFLSLNDASLLLKSLPERRRLMKDTFEEQPAQFQFVEHVDLSAESTRDLPVDEIEDDEGEEKKTPKKAASKGKTGKQTTLPFDKADPASEEVDQDLDVDARSSDDEVDDNEDVDVLEVLPSKAEGKSLEVDETSPAAASSSSIEAPPLVASSGVISNASDIIREFLNSTATIRGEGVMAKSLSAHSTYEPDVRTDQWCKLKKDYIAGFGIADSIDVVIIGSWWGQGRKAGWMSPFLAAVYNPETEELESFCKIMSGFTDEVYKTLTAECEKLIIPGPKKYYRVHESLTPSMWLEPVKVWEIRGADLTISPIHSAGVGLVHDERGISLRFPRFIRAREDKSVEDASTSDQIAHLYRNQSLKSAAPNSQRHKY